MARQAAFAGFPFPAFANETTGTSANVSGGQLNGTGAAGTVSALTASPRTMSLAASAAQLARVVVLVAAPAAMALGGKAAALSSAKSLQASFAPISIASKSAALIRATGLTVSRSALAAMPSAAAIAMTRSLQTSPGALSAAAQSVSTSRSVSLSTTPAAMAAAPKLAAASQSRSLQATTAALAATAVPAVFGTGRSLAAASAAMSMSVGAVALSASHLLSAASSAVALAPSTARLNSMAATITRQSWIASFPFPAMANETGSAQRAIPGGFINEVPGSRSVSLAALPASVGVAPGSATITPHQTTTGFQAAAGALALGAGAATLASTRTASAISTLVANPVAVATGAQQATISRSAGATAAAPVSTRQAGVSSFPFPAFANETSSNQRAVAGAYLNETPQTRAYQLVALAASMATAARPATLLAHASVATLAPAPASFGMSPGLASLATKAAPVPAGVIPRLGFGLGLSLSLVPLISGASIYALTAASSTFAMGTKTASLAVVLANASSVQPLRVIASGLRLNDSAASGSAGKTQSISRQPVWFGGDTTEARPTFNNWYYATTGASTTPPTAITIVKASLEKGDGSITIPLTFGGARSITLQPNDQDIQADPVLPSAFNLTKFSADSQWWVRCSMLLPSTSGVFPTNIATGNTIAGAKSVIYPPANDIDQVDSTGVLTTPANASSANANIGAVAIIGRYVNDAASRSVMFGPTDRIGVGVGDGAPFCPLGSGFAARALSSNGSGTPTNVIAAIFASRAGSGITAHMQNTLEMYWFKYAKTLCDEIGTNSLPGSPNNSTFLSQQQAYWSAFRSAGGQRIIKFWITPKTTSSDSFATASGQTPAAGRGAGNVPGIDDWDASMKAQVTNGNIDAYVDSPSLRDGTDPHLWFSNGTAGYATADGLHPSMVMHVAKGADTRAAILNYG